MFVFDIAEGELSMCYYVIVVELSNYLYVILLEVSYQCVCK